MRLWAIDQYSNWTYPFELVTLTARTSCRCCDHKASKEFYRIAEKQGLAFDPEADHPIKTNPWMKKGQQAIRHVTTSGPAGTAYICIPCAKQLLANLKAQLEKVE